ncbi:hypothetical protein K8I31_19320 [bacterium]|nr:hypothetical protein [bacterium]
MTDMNHNEQPTNNPPDAAPVGSRSERMRPRCVDELIKALDMGKLDGRTKEAKTLESIKAALDENFEAVAIELIHRQISSVTTILNAIEGAVFREGSIIEDGKLNPIVESHFQKYLEQVRKLIAYRASLKSAGGAAASFPVDEPPGEPDPVDSLLEIEREQRAADDAQAADAKFPVTGDLETPVTGNLEPETAATSNQPEVF